ncbi:hypothetical protein F0231_10120 [Vibrio sp. RE86]|uniref:hypothetical protein n=1 Tax=Vibrio sp. RE86 TaxID=2607605 RepID=UPI0014936A4B|nr:hypothetical protein [Vibrio sp. RE86]
MNKYYIGVAAILGIVIGGGIALAKDTQVNRHFNSNTILHIGGEDSEVTASLPVRFELTLKENGTYDVFSMLPRSQVGFSGKGSYAFDADGVMFIHDMHTPLDLDNAKDGLIEQLFVRPGSFDGMMQLVQVSDHESILIGQKAALLLKE